MAPYSILLLLNLIPAFTFALTSTGAADAQIQASAEQTCAKSGPNFKPVYDASGMPVECKAPPQPMCFFGAYTDPKTGLEGCCGRGNGTFSTDPTNPKEGACCVAPKTYSFDTTSNKGSCCEAGQAYTFDAANGVGGCCASPATYKCNCASPPSPTPVTDDNQPPPAAPTKCPDAHGWTFTQDGVDYTIDCDKGWAQKLGQGDWTKAADIWECLKNCGAAGPKCQGVNYWASSQDCGFALTWEYPATGTGNPDLMAAIPIKQKS